MRTILFDVDTQLDFLFPSGALYVPGAERLITQFGALMRFAKGNNLQIISTADAHSERDPEFQTWKPHCIIGTAGQQKAAATLTGKPVILGTAPDAFDAIRESLKETSQIVVEKQQFDAFTNPNLLPLLALLKADRYLVYGVVSEMCVRHGALGLLSQGTQVEVVLDAIKALEPACEEEFLREFQSAGGRLTTVASVVG